mmetsp:Transcript_16396/g.37946  ORF Transcript_16396/g.37946 Transcript_16396/m.37946 type:complete len:332 (+) Transcript_16396:184-1179(+)
MAMQAETTSFVVCNGSGKCSKRGSSKIVGRSRAGDATAFAIPEFKWLFDCGTVVQEWKPRIIFLTHTHSDHVHFLFRYRDEDRPPTIYLPKKSVPLVETCMQAYAAMTDNGYDDEDGQEEKESTEQPANRVEYILRATMPDEEIFFTQGGNKFVARTLNMDHRIPCLGYNIFKLRSRLKSEYIGLPSREIGQLRKAGVEITRVEEEPYLCFMGDTTTKVFEDYPEILNQNSTVIVECSFIDEKSRQRAETTKHTHWDDLQPYVASHPGTMFVLIHFSLKYSTLTLRRFFQEQQVMYDNIHPMLIEREVEEQWLKTGEQGSPPRCNCRVCRN